MCESFTPPSVVYGIVYGGDERESGGRTWVSRGVVTDGTLSVDRCAPVEEWFDTTAASPGTPTLTTFLADLPSTAAVGLDFPFGLPAGVVAEESWAAFVRDLPSWYDSPDDLRRRCERRVRRTDSSSDARFRATDGPLSTMSPFADPIVASTFYGLRDVLRPLVLSDSVRVPPMTDPRSDRPFVVEVYPTGTLVDLDLFDTGDEDGGDEGETRRAETLDGLCEAADAEVEVADDVRESIVADPDRLESVVAVYAVYRNSRTASALAVSDSQRLIEGQVFI
ncbi:DUF429 domain-containing protein [Salinigranum marinum]|uniref:DUF429 domain-containing protein n=1 Tax=Salinigranum marinum TaxID=1515595 RepID=UPI002989B18C|nr:DUF429 domain-containing protein [Salinigranum marinum]